MSLQEKINNLMNAMRHYGYKPTQEEKNLLGAYGANCIPRDLLNNSTNSLKPGKSGKKD